LRPFTLPNLIGYLRLAALPVFLALAFESEDGRTAATAILFAAISGSDYLDGFIARVTGQYSRMGAILDPVVDRLTVLSGAAVCWHFELLPRWALIVLVVRELAVRRFAAASTSRSTWSGGSRSGS
jgi:cardiolipin synthase